MAGFSNVLYPISAGISEGVQTGDDVTVSVRNLTKSFRPARCGERSGWACERPERGGEGYMKNIFASTSYLVLIGGGGTFMYPLVLSVQKRRTSSLCCSRGFRLGPPHGVVW